MYIQTVCLGKVTQRASHITSISVPPPLYPSANSSSLQTTSTNTANFGHITSKLHHRNAPTFQPVTILLNVPEDRKSWQIITVRRMLGIAFTCADHLKAVFKLIGRGVKEKRAKTREKEEAGRWKVLKKTQKRQKGNVGNNYGAH